MRCTANAMNARSSTSNRERLLLAVLLGLCAGGGTGCAYFRSGSRTYGESTQIQQEQQQINKLWFKPGTVFYTQ